jgi:hypothetical protein
VSWRAGSAIVVVLAVAVALVVVGRWQRSSDDTAVNREIAAVRASVGPLDSPTLTGFRVLPSFDCLIYARAGNPFGLELCVDAAGRVVEAIDRRGGHRRFWTLQFDPAAATVRVDRAQVERLIRKMEA